MRHVAQRLPQLQHLSARLILHKLLLPASRACLADERRPAVARPRSSRPRCSAANPAACTQHAQHLGWL